MCMSARQAQTKRLVAAAPWKRAISQGVAELDGRPNTQSFLDSLNVLNRLPFSLPRHSWLHWGIGSTPVTKVEDRIYAKLEGESPGGSLKDRTISALVLNALADGRVRPQGDTLMLVTSGSAGKSLVKIKQALEVVPELELDVIVVMPQAYAHKEVPAAIIALDGVSTFHSEAAMLEDIRTSPKGKARVLLLEGVFMDVLARSKELAAEKSWLMVDQHFDQHAVTGHKSTAEEIMRQCPQVTDVVCATGTGATAAGLLKYLPEGVKVHSRPAQSGSIDGLSDLARYDNFCDQGLLQGYSHGFFCHSTALTMQEKLQNTLGMACGPSTGATYWLAKDIVSKNPSANVVFICADGRRQQESNAVLQQPAVTFQSQINCPPVDMAHGMKWMLPVMSGSMRSAFQCARPITTMAQSEGK